MFIVHWIFPINLFYLILNHFQNSRYINHFKHLLNPFYADYAPQLNVN